MVYIEWSVGKGTKREKRKHQLHPWSNDERKNSFLSIVLFISLPHSHLQWAKWKEKAKRK